MNIFLHFLNAVIGIVSKWTAWMTESVHFQKKKLCPLHNPGSYITTFVFSLLEKNQTLWSKIRHLNHNKRTLDLLRKMYNMIKGHIKNCEIWKRSGNLLVAQKKISKTISPELQYKKKLNKS